MTWDRFWLRDSIHIAIYDMSWSSLWDREKRCPGLRDYINRTKFLYNVLNDAGIVENRL